MRALALDDDGDLDLSSGTVTLVSGVDAVAQRIRGRLRLWRGEWFADLTVGVPCLTFLGQKNAAGRAESVLRQAIANCPGVASLLSFSLAFDAAARHATVVFRARTTDGQVVEDGGFRLDLATPDTGET